MLEDLLVAIDRLGKVLAVDCGLGQEGEVVEGVGLDLGRAAEPGQSIVPAPFVLQCQSQADAGLRHLWVLPDRFTVTPPSLGEMAQGAIDIAEVVVSLRHLGLQGDGGLAMGQSFVGSARSSRNCPRLFRARRGGGRARRPGSCVRVPGLARPGAQRGAQIGVGHRVVGSRFQHVQE